MRYLCFRDAEGFADAVLKRLPERIEIGPVYTDKPDRNKTASKDSFKPIERELIVRGRRRPRARVLLRAHAHTRSHAHARAPPPPARHPAVRH